MICKGGIFLKPSLQVVLQKLTGMTAGTEADLSSASHHLNNWVTARVAPDIISSPGPGRNPAKFSYPALYDMAAGYEVGFDHLSMHLPHNASLISWLKLITMFCVLQFCYCWVLTNDYWFINLMVYREILMIAMVLLFTLVCFIAAYIVTLCDVA